MSISTGVVLLLILVGILLTAGYFKIGRQRRSRRNRLRVSNRYQRSKLNLRDFVYRDIFLLANCVNFFDLFAVRRRANRSMRTACSAKQRRCKINFYYFLLFFRRRIAKLCYLSIASVPERAERSGRSGGRPICCGYRTSSKQCKQPLPSSRTNDLVTYQKSTLKIDKNNCRSPRRPSLYKCRRAITQRPEAM